MKEILMQRGPLTPSLVKEQNRLLAAYEEETKRPNIRTKLLLIAETLTMLAAQTALANALKMKSLETAIQLRHSKERLLHD